MKRTSAAGLVFIAVQTAVAPAAISKDPPPKVVPVSPAPKPSVEDAPVPKVVPVQPPPSPSPSPREETPPAAPPKFSTKEPSLPPAPTAPPPATSKEGAAPAAGQAPLKPSKASPFAPESPSLKGEPGARMEVPATPPASAAAPKLSPNAAANAEQAQLGLADALYARQQWDAAIAEYQRFINEFPRSAQLAPALYRLAESYQNIGNQNSARLYFSKVVAVPQSGPFGGAAAFKLAEAEFQERDFASAVAHYKTAEQQLPDQKAKISAKYFTARSLQELGRKLEARGIFQTLADMPEKHPFQEVSQFQVALLLVEANHGAEALPRFEKLAAEAASAEIRAESITRIALISLESDPKKAVPSLEKALAAEGTQKWHSLLHVGMLKACFALGDHEKVISAFANAEAAIDPAQLPEVQLTVGDAHRQLKQYTEAAALYSKLIEASPDTKAAATARYQRLVCYYNMDRRDLPQQIEAFLATKPKPADRDKAQLMRAEVLRLRGDYAGAGASYAEVVKSKELKAESRPDALMRWAECAVRTADSQATITATTELLSIAPNYPLASTALFWRAETRRRAKQLVPAEKDYEELLKKFPTFAERETVLRQMALIRGEQNDNGGMARYFELLLKEFPESPNRAEANHWIGRASFESKDYKKAVPFLEEARKLNAEEYFDSDSLRLVYCAYNLNDPDQFWTRVQEYLPKGKARISQDVLRWCAQNYIEAKQPAKAEPVLTLVCSGDELTDTDWLQLATARLPLNNHSGVLQAVQSYMPLVKHPAAKARGLLLKAKAELGQANLAAAQKTIDEALRLQPDGLLNGEARMVAADIQLAEKNTEAAAKLYESVSIVFDDEIQLAPLAMEQAYLAYKACGKLKEAMAILNRLQSKFPEYARERNLK